MEILRRIKEYIRINFPTVFFILKRINGLIKSLFKPISDIINNFRKRSAARRISLHHSKLRKELQGKSSLRVVFIVQHHSVWKMNEVFNSMITDLEFEPTIFLVPMTDCNNQQTKTDQRETLSFFEAKGYHTVCITAREGVEHAIDEMVAINPDVVFFTNHYPLSFAALYRFVLNTFLTCYLPYSVNVSSYGNNQSQYNLEFHNLVWKIFAPHSIASDTFRRVQAVHGKNVVVTGYPGLEQLTDRQGDEPAVDPWKPLGLKRMIWAPHHSIDMPELPYANFLRYAQLFRDLVGEYSDRVQWCFKPHPLLKTKLFNHKDWGVERTEEYFKFWSTNANTQFQNGDYSDLFCTSDAMIHDSGSFIAEYLYTNKPVMFLWSSPNLTSFFNEYGKQALEASEPGVNEADIRRFINSLIAGSDTGHPQRQKFLSRHPIMIDGKKPSQRIIWELRSILMRNGPQRVSDCRETS